MASKLSILYYISGLHFTKRRHLRAHENLPRCYYIYCYNGGNYSEVDSAHPRQMCHVDAISITITLIPHVPLKVAVHLMSFLPKKI